jgi:hypothetical protein
MAGLFSTERELSQLAVCGGRLTPAIAGRLVSAEVLRLGTCRAPANPDGGSRCKSAHYFAGAFQMERTHVRCYGNPNFARETGKKVFLCGL